MDDWPDGLTDSELRACAVAEHPAFRTGAELDRIDPLSLSAGERVDLLAVLEEQRRWFDAAQLRLLAAIQAGDESPLGLGQEVVSLALQLPLRTAQNRLAQAETLVTELPRTLAAVSAGSMSAAHASVLAEAVWRLPADPALPAALEDSVLPPVLAAGCVTVPQLRRRVRRAALALDPRMSASARPGVCRVILGCVAPSGTSCRTRGDLVEPWPKGIAAVTLFVEDLAATRQFYAETFGLPVVFEDPQSAVFRFGGTLVNLLDSSAAVELVAPAAVGDSQAGPRMQFTVEVEDVDAMCEQLTSRGVQLLNGPMDRPWGIRTASFQDPAGHVWEIAH
ncbi:MAG TPA: VOC family protein [Jatrophihabitans sp.]|nr:VOC family protein [Jatrophihabitans sp.]